jgi:peptidoglycan hydrolase-like protein with peptidoglycan-binding domain
MVGPITTAPVSRSTTPSGASEAPPAQPGSTLRLGSTGPEVIALQKKLNALGENLPVNGHFGPRTLEAVRRFQMAANARGDGPLVVSGNVDAATQRVLQGKPRSAGWAPAAGTAASKPQPKPAAATAAAAPAQAQAGRNADLRFDVFDNASGWKPFFTGARYGDKDAQDAPFSQRVSQRVQLMKDNTIFCETKAVVKAPAEKILSQLTDPHFWANGAVDSWTKQPDGSFTYALWPAGKMGGLGVKVNETMHAPERQPDGSYIVRIDLKRKGNGSQIMPGQADGLAYFLIKPRPDGSTEVSGRFAGVRESSPAFNAEQFAQNHLLAERGELKSGTGFLNHFLPNGTGVGAMLQRAEQR